MPARAIWKGVINFGIFGIPVKLYSAIQDRSVHFRLLHKKDKVPLRQAMINPDTGEVVPHEDVLRGYKTPNDEMVILTAKDLEQLEPEASRDIEVINFLPVDLIDHRFYDRSYFLGPDADSDSYFSLISALEYTGLEGLVRWVMRKKEYFGALRLRGNYPVLITLRHAEQVVSIEGLAPPESRELDNKEIKMAEQLLSALEEEFDPAQYHDDYRGRVMELIEKKSRGEKMNIRRIKPKKDQPDLKKVLQASLKQAGRRKSA